jgi:hypothetical protein
MPRTHTRSWPSSPLVEAVRSSDADGPLVSVVLSTYGLGLDPPFFENDFLPALLGIGGIRDGGYASPLTLERRLADAYFGLVVDSHAIAEGGRPSLQIEMVPVGHKTNHAKIVLLHRKRRIRLVVTSANLTHDGYRLQREVAAVLDFSPEGGLPGHVLEAALKSWLVVLGESASDSLRAALLAAAAQAVAWSPNPAVGAPQVVWGGGPDPLWRQLTDAWPAGEPVTEWAICSPFWPEPGGATPFEAIASALTDKGVDLRKTTLHVLACADSMGDRALPVFPFHLVEHLKSRGFSVGSGRIIPVRRETLTDELPEAGLPEERVLHAKWVLLLGPKTGVLLLGSANFTRKGLGVFDKTESANIEAGVLLRRSASDLSFANLAPPILEKGIVDWLRCEASDVADGPRDEVDPRVPWPEWITRIEIVVEWMAIREPAGVLRIFTESSASHPEFIVGCPVSKVDGELPLVTVPARTGDAPRKATKVAIDGSTLRRLLVCRDVTIRWADECAVYPVNVDASSRVGLPRVLAVHPDEEQLLAYFHGRIGEDDLVRTLADPTILERRMASLADPENNERLRALQSYLMREFVESLYGLKQILIDAAQRSPRAFEQAALGEFSPLALASEVAKATRSGHRSPTAAAFQLVELLSLLAALEIPSAEVKPDRATLDEIRARAVSAILQIVTAAAGTAAVREAFAGRNFSSYARSVLSPPTFTRWRTAVAASAPLAPSESP